LALVERLARLRKLGFRLAVDDIGAGYSGLTSFTELMPEVVKLDMSLVRDVHLSALKQRTIAALCKLCHEVGCIVVGKAFETVDEQDCLRSIGCDLLQGYCSAGRTRPCPTCAELRGLRQSDDALEQTLDVDRLHEMDVEAGAAAARTIVLLTVSGQRDQPWSALRELGADSRRELVAIHHRQTRCPAPRSSA